MRVSGRRRFLSFKDQLKELGFDSYSKYLASPHWKGVRVDYESSDLPQFCLGCKSNRFELHHRTYTRLGNEKLVDLIPLCRECHKKVHDYAKNHDLGIHDTHLILREIFGWTKTEMRRRCGDFLRSTAEPSTHRRIKQSKADRFHNAHVRRLARVAANAGNVAAQDAEKLAARYAFDALFDAFEKNKPEDQAVRKAVRLILDELKAKGD